MKTKRINTGIYRVTMDGREFRVERMIHEDGHRDPNPWMLVEEYPNTAKQSDYWNHFRTLRDAKDAIFNQLSSEWQDSSNALTEAEKSALIPVSGADYWWKIEPKQISVGVEGTKSVYRSKRGANNVKAMVERILVKHGTFEQMAANLYLTLLL